MIKSIGFALDPSNVPSFLLDWELTKLCNLDCSYCGDGPHGGHDNSTKHPPYDECLQTIDFMYQYVDIYMKYKKETQRKVILNVYGGESIFHPRIVDILTACREKYAPYKDKWYLTITCTTNGIVASSRWTKIVELVDEFSVSYHPETTDKQRQQYLDNIMYLKKQNKRFKSVIMMHNDPVYFEKSEKIAELCAAHNIRYVKKPLDNPEKQWAYTTEQFSKLKTFWMNSVPASKKDEHKNSLSTVGTSKEIVSIAEGRPCCGGRKLSLNNDLKSCVSFVPKQGFKDWYCSVNWFFLFVQQITKEVYTNKDCRMSTTGKVEPLGNLNNYQALLDQVKQQLETNTMPVIQCAKEVCMCGFCAPKADNLSDFTELLSRNLHKEK